MAINAAPLTVVILAAGQGTRLRSKTIKLLHPVAGRPMVSWVLDAARSLRPSRLVTVIGHQADLVRATLGDTGGKYALQREQRGTGHAVVEAARAIDRSPGAIVLIVNGDLPTLRAATLRKLVARHKRSGAALSLLTARIDDPTGYGRIVRDGGNVDRIVEHADATADERTITEINCGIYCAGGAELLRVLRRLRPNNAQGEYYITDAVRAFIDAGKKVVALCHDDAAELLGVNTRQELAAAARTLYERSATRLQDAGVTLLDPSRTWIDPHARIGRDSIIYPDVIVEGSCVLGEDCIVRSGCRLVDVRIGNGVEIKDHSVVLDSRIGHGATVGPFAHVRPGSVLDANSRVGNFVELKQTHLGKGSKASHLTYLGDAEIGPDCNVGAGTITCNYDGVNKHRTRLGRGVFICSNSQLVAPVELEDGAYVAAGSTVTEDVPKDALAIGRSRQRNIPGWAAANRKRQARSRKR